MAVWVMFQLYGFLYFVKILVNFRICPLTIGVFLYFTTPLTPTYSRVPNTKGGGDAETLINFQKFYPPPARIKTLPFFNFGKTMSKAQYDFYTKFCSKGKPLQCIRKRIQMFSFRKEVIAVHSLS